MKGIFCLAALFALGVAMPPHKPSVTSSVNGRITDPNVLADLEVRHARSLARMKEGEKVNMHTDELIDYLNSPSALQKRLVLPLVDMIGFWIEWFGETVTLGAEIENEILKALAWGQDQHTIWTEPGHCRIYFQTHAGHELNFQSWNISSEDTSLGKPDTNVNVDSAWNEPQSTSPPVLYFNNDFLGAYSVQFTATDQVAWSGINGTEKCVIEGICNPQYVFYRNGYNIIMNTWQTQGIISACEYSHGGDCEGVCYSGVLNQFSTDGDVWGGWCAVPCAWQGGDGYSTQPVPTPTPVPDVSVMVVGDSISHGMEADWTWRWRIFAWLQNSWAVSFVGPWFGTYGPTPEEYAVPQPPLLPGENAEVMNIPTGLYNAGVPDYFTDSHHAAWWGHQAAQSKTTINAWVQSSQPDYLFILLGFNDLGWWVSDPLGLLHDMEELVGNARAAKPDIKMLIGNVVDRTFLNGRQDLVDNTKTYNQMLRDAIPSWSTSESPISYVDVNSNYNCRPSGCPDGHDGLHPNSMGEYHIAQAFANVLQADFGYPGPAFVVPSSAEPRVVTTPTGFQVESMPEGLWAAWNMVETARNYDLRSRLQGVSEWWTDGAVSTWASLSTWLIDGQTWEFQVRTYGDNDDASDWSDIVAATAHLKTSPGPQDIQAVPVGSDNIQISWAPVTGYDVNRYGVIVWDKDTKGAFIQEYATTGTTYTATGLNTGHRYGTWVATYVNLESSVTGKVYPAGGLPAGGPELYVGGGTPSPPRNLVATNTDPTTVSITWDASAYTASYSIYVRSVRDNTAFQLGGTTTDTTVSWAYLFPGTWNFEFCVAAVNGELQSSYTDACVIPPVYPGYSQNDKRLVGTINSSAIVFNSTSNTTTTQGQELSMLWQLLAQSRARNSSSPPS